jgi:hypothetical protein
VGFGGALFSLRFGHRCVIFVVVVLLLLLLLLNEKVDTVK